MHHAFKHEGIGQFQTQARARSEYSVLSAAYARVSLTRRWPRGEALVEAAVVVLAAALEGAPDELCVLRQGLIFN